MASYDVKLKGSLLWFMRFQAYGNEFVMLDHTSYNIIILAIWHS